MGETILEVKNLHTAFVYKDSQVNVLNGVNYKVKRGEILGIVGESGSGKSVSVYSIMKLLGKNARITGEINLDGRNIVDYSEKEMRKIRGARVSMIFQDPMTSLNPVYTIGTQIKEAIKVHGMTGREEVQKRAEELLELVGISDGKKRLRQYPHELSGGMRQRVVIAMALASEPEILIADEPTTALDVTVQAQILELIKKLTEEENMATILITHDLGVVVNMCDEIVVMYAGRICEKGSVEDIFYNPKHEYTKGLIAAVPDGTTRKPLKPIPGAAINLKSLPKGCAFCARCSAAMNICADQLPQEKEVAPGHMAACWVNEMPDIGGDKSGR